MAPLERECSGYEEAIQEYVDGRGTIPMPARLQAHMQGCNACRELLEEYRFMDKAARRLPSPEAPDDLLSGIMEHVAAINVKHRQHQGLPETIIAALKVFVPAYGLATIAAVMLIMLFLVGSPEMQLITLQGSSTSRYAGMEYINGYADQSLTSTVESMEGIVTYWRQLSHELSDRLTSSRSPAPSDSYSSATAGWYALTGLVIMVLVNYTLIRRKEEGGHSSCKV